jgi:hypothetical protein
MRTAFAFGLLTLAACAASHPESSRPTTETVRVGGSGGGVAGMRIASTEGAARADIAYPPDKVWDVLKEVYDSLSIPVGTVDPARRLLGNTGFKAHQRLGKTSLGRYIDCGRAQGFPSADSYDVYLSITTQVQPGKGGRSTLSTMVEAAGRPMAFSGDYTRCGSLGTLESAINDGVRKRLSKG